MQGNPTRLRDVVDDTTPQLGGDLDVNGKDITSTTDINIKLGDAAGNNKLYVKDSAGNTVAVIDSDGNINVTGSVAVDDTTASTSPTTGSLQTAGGLGVGGDTFLGGKLNIETIIFPAFSVKGLTTATNAAAATTILHRETSNNMVDGFGLNLQFRISDDASSNNIIARVEATRDGGDNIGQMLLKAGINGNTNYIRLSASSDNIQLLKNTNVSGTLDVSGDIINSPSSSVTPANNGELVVEATSNTLLTLKFKGSDGTIRSGTITLA